MESTCHFTWHFYACR
nr:unnamed protein product [Callosobruchus analis]